MSRALCLSLAGCLRLSGSLAPAPPTRLSGTRARCALNLARLLADWPRFAPINNARRKSRASEADEKSTLAPDRSGAGFARGGDGGSARAARFACSAASLRPSSASKACPIAQESGSACTGRHTHEPSIVYNWPRLFVALVHAQLSWQACIGKTVQVVCLPS